MSGRPTSASKRRVAPRGLTVLPDRKTLVVPLCDALSLASDGTTSWVYLDLELAFLDRYGPFVDTVRIHTLTRGRSASHAWKVVFWTSADGRTWTGPTDFDVALTANGYDIAPAYDNAGTLGVRWRLGLAVRSTSAGDPDVASVSAWAVLRFVT